MKTEQTVKPKPDYLFLLRTTSGEFDSFFGLCFAMHCFLHFGGLLWTFFPFPIPGLDYFQLDLFLDNQMDINSVTFSSLFFWRKKFKLSFQLPVSVFLGWGHKVVKGDLSFIPSLF